MKIFAVRIGDKYGPEYEEYLEDKLLDYELAVSYTHLRAHET